MHYSKNCSIESMTITKMDKINFNSEINEEIILVNPKEIYNFISGDEKFIELINYNFLKIKECFPHSLIYLEFFKDFEGDRRESICAKIYNPYGNYKENCKIFNSFLEENIDALLSKDLNFYLSIIPNDEFIKKS